MFGKDFQRKYALSDQGVKNARTGTFWTVIVNLVVMGGMGILYVMMRGFLATLTDGAPLPRALPIVILVLAFLLLSFITHLQQYKATYGLVYGEVKKTRISLAEHLRRLPLGYFGKRDLADLTETIMGDVNRLEHVWSHCLGYLYGSYISTAIIAVMLFAYNWKLALACLWGVPVAFVLLFGSRKMAKRHSEITKAAGVRVSDGIQETLENIREIRATNQEARFLNELNEKIDYHEHTMLRGELSTGIFVNAASVIMRLGVATTILIGTKLILSGQIDFLVLFMFLLVITRVYAPFDQALALIAEMFVSQVSASRLMEIYDAKTAEGSERFGSFEVLTQGEVRKVLADGRDPNGCYYPMVAWVAMAYFACDLWRTGFVSEDEVANQDYEYLKKLSTDAAPAIYKHDPENAEMYIKKNHSFYEDRSWRQFNISAYTAELLAED